jgi:hypothetical protein
MKGLVKLAAGLVTLALVTPGIASATPDVDDPTPIEPISPFAEPPGYEHRGIPPLSINAGIATDVVTQQSMDTYVAPQLSAVSFLPFAAPKSLLIYRGTGVVAQVNDIGVHAAVLQDGELTINPPSLQPVWVSNVGTPFGSAMGTALIVVHNEVRGQQSPLNAIANVQVGDMVDVTLTTGDIVRFEVKPEGLTMPRKGPSEFRNTPHMLEVVICAPDGEHLYRLRAERVL